MNIASNLERANERFSNTVALIFEGKEYRYCELNAMSNRIANALTNIGIASGDRVALFLPNIPPFITFYYGIQKIGAIAVAINPSLKPQEVEFILNDCQAKVIVTTAALREQIPLKNLPHLEQILITEGDSETDTSLHEFVSLASPYAESIDMLPGAPSTILYSSGTTGFPKGVILPHSAVVSTVQVSSATLGIEPADRILLFLPVFHSYALYVALNACIEAGARLILHRGFELEAIYRSILEYQVTIFFGVPTIYTLMSEQAPPDALKSLRLCMSGGATLPRPILQAWKDKFGMIISEGYGLTEYGLICYNHASRHKPDSVGTPVDGTELRIADEYGESVPQGEMGEVVVRGTNMMLGYWSQPIETDKVTQMGWLHTGDMGRVDEDGYLYLIDRKKDMIIVGGQNVYPSEVEQVLYRHPDVAEAAVYGVPNSILGEQVRARLVLKANQTASQTEVIDFCRASLAHFKLPSVVEFAETLPKNRAGKILKRVLREEFEEEETAQSSSAPVTIPQQISHASVDAQYEILAKHVRTEIRHLVGIEPSGEQSFFDLGMNSLMSIQLTDRLSASLNISLPTTFLIDHPSLQDLIATLLKILNSPDGEDTSQLLQSDLKIEKSMAYDVPYIAKILKMIQVKDANLAEKLDDTHPDRYERTGGFIEIFSEDELNELIYHFHFR